MATEFKAERAVNTDGKLHRTLKSNLGPSFADLPKEISVNILARLSVKRIFICKCVCKIWCAVISGSEFAKFHFEQAEFCPLIQTGSSTLVSRSLFLLQSDRDDLEAKLDMCGYSDSPVYVKLDTNFKLPLRNFEMLNSDDTVEKGNYMKLEIGNHGYSVVNSCNGLLCLSHAMASVICNPITGEFINLPNSTHSPFLNMISGFGFSPATNQYKVIKTFLINEQDSITGTNKCVWIVEVHTLGTESWRKACSFSDLRKFQSMNSPTYVNGRVFWYSSKSPRSIISFDIEKERFDLVSMPTHAECDLRYDMTIGVLGGELFIWGTTLQSAGVWVMKDDSGKIWSKVVSIVLPLGDGLSRGQIMPIKLLNDGSLLMIDFKNSALVYKDPSGGRLICLKVSGARIITKVIAHIPSFVSLKDTLSGLNMKVFNVNSRCAKLKLLGDSKYLSFVEWTPGTK